MSPSMWSPSDGAGPRPMPVRVSAAPGWRARAPRRGRGRRCRSRPWHRPRIRLPACAGGARPPRPADSRGGTRPPVAWSTTRPTACLVTYQPSPVTSPSEPGSARSRPAMRGDGMADVVVARPAGEPEPAGDRERPAGIVEGKARARGRRSARRRGSTSRGRRGPRRRCLRRPAPGRVSPARRMAGEERRSARCERNQWSWASAPDSGKTHRSSGTPARRAAATEHRIRAAPWSTRSLAFMSFGYGNDTMRLVGPTVRISSPSRRCVSTRRGSSAATAENAPTSPTPAAGARRCVSPAAARKAFSNRGKTRSGRSRPRAGSTSVTGSTVGTER